MILYNLIRILGNTRISSSEAAKRHSARHDSKSVKPKIRTPESITVHCRPENSFSKFYCISVLLDAVSVSLDKKPVFNISQLYFPKLLRLSEEAHRIKSLCHTCKYTFFRNLLFKKQ